MDSLSRLKMAQRWKSITASAWTISKPGCSPTLQTQVRLCTCMLVHDSARMSRKHWTLALCTIVTNSRMECRSDGEDQTIRRGWQISRPQAVHESDAIFGEPCQLSYCNWFVARVANVFWLRPVDSYEICACAFALPLGTRHFAPFGSIPSLPQNGVAPSTCLQR